VYYIFPVVPVCHPDAWLEKDFVKSDQFEYSGINTLALFKGSHPAIILERIEKKNWKFDYDIVFSNLSIKDRFKKFLRKYLGIEIGYKSYIKISSIPSI